MAGGSNVETNLSLHTIVERARRAGVPRDIIDRNMRHSEDKSSANITEHIIEVYGPCGSGFLMDCLTDNKQRAVTSIWTIVKKLNGKARPSAVAYS
jgi:transcriptional/translational regulatory protein YebC/TACO1